MEKEWNERIADLVSQSTSDDEAQDLASADSTLDEYITIAPIRLYDGLPDRRRRSTARGDRLGNFPVCPDAEIPASFADLNMMSTVHFTVIPTAVRVRALSALVVAHLQHNLSAHFAFRSLSKLEELERVVGHWITKVTATRTSKRLNVALLLDDGTSLNLSGDKDPVKPEGPARPARRLPSPKPAG
jgi:hypothetical protein